jgi:xylan 1,4-beta-xylosidase
MSRPFLVFACRFVLLGAFSLGGEGSVEISIDGASPGPAIRALHGVNGGPLAAGGLLDLTNRWKEASFPVARLHDSHWPNPDVVDVHAIFPDPQADPSNPGSYDFERSDEYVRATHDCGAAIVYRLGESIEHQKAKRYAHPPRDPQKWAAVCAGIVRHYTQGWAKGMKLPIKYWEIWNEPDNRPNCWTGTDEQYFRLYATAATTLRKEFPGIKIGGPGLGNTGELKGARLEPTPFLKAFLARCKEDKLPLDFLSWHCYSGDPTEFVRRAKGIRALLDEHGLKATESHLNEWNYLPGGKWDGMMAKEFAVRERWHTRLNGAEGAAFVVSTLTHLQDAPVDVANYFTAEAPGMGLFSPHGTPSRAFGAFRAFKEMAGLKRLPLKGDLPNGVTALAGMGKEVRVLLARTHGEGGPVKIHLNPAPWQGATYFEIMSIEDGGVLRKTASGQVDRPTFLVDLPSSSVRLVRIWQP